MLHAQDDLCDARTHEIIGGFAFGEPSAPQGAAAVETLFSAGRTGLLASDTGMLEIFRPKDLPSVRLAIVAVRGDLRQ
jgi:hypothetical protein